MMRKLHDPGGTDEDEQRIAEKIIASFHIALQDEVDPDQVAGRLLVVVQETMQPEQVSLWLSDSRGRPA